MSIPVEGKTLFITGGAGFIGSALAERLVENNKIVVYDSLNRNSIQHKSCFTHPNLTFIQGDVLDFPSLAKAMKGADIVVHAAAIAGIDTVIQRPVNTMRVNMVGSANVLEAAAQLDRVDRVVCFSTSEVFGQHAFRTSEAGGAVIGEVGEARWTYAVSKLAEEHLAIAYHREQGLPTTVLRPFNVYGPGQVGEGALRTFIRQAILNEDIHIHGEGTQIRAWCYVDDMIEALMLTLNHPGAVGESFNIGNPRAVVTIYGLANAVVRILGSKSKILFSKTDYADVELRVPHVEKSQRVLGFVAKVDLDQGIYLTADYFWDVLRKEKGF